MRYTQQFPITPDDDANVPSFPIDAFYVGGGDGSMVAIDETGKEVTYAGLLTGHVYQFALVRILDTGTGATNIVGLKR